MAARPALVHAVLFVGAFGEHARVWVDQVMFHPVVAARLDVLPQELAGLRAQVAALCGRIDALCGLAPVATPAGEEQTK